MANGAWYHVVGTYDGAQQRIYVNGAMENSAARTGSIPDYGQILAIGKYALDNNSNFDGTLDEVRVSKTARGADWIKLSYAGQRSDQKLITFQRMASQCQTRFAVPKDTAVDEGALNRPTAPSRIALTRSKSPAPGRTPLGKFPRDRPPVGRPGGTSPRSGTAASRSCSSPTSWRRPRSSATGSR